MPKCGGLFKARVLCIRPRFMGYPVQDTPFVSRAEPDGSYPDKTVFTRQFHGAGLVMDTGVHQ